MSKIIIKSINDLKNKNICVLGFGKEGRSVVDFLSNQGIDTIVIHDKKEIENINYKSISGENYLKNLDKYDIIIKTPGISYYSKELIPHRDKIISATQIFFSLYKGKIITITGTKGKSTTSSLLTYLLDKLNYRVKLVGNIGNPVLDEIDLFGDIQYDYIIYELSSYMLENFEPESDIALLTNIYRCHLDWHLNMENYTCAKLNIFTNAKIKIAYGDISGIDNDVLKYGTKGYFTFNGSHWYYQDHKLNLSTNNLKIKGDHNAMNICGVLSVVLEIVGKESFENKISDIINILKEFNGLEHRLQDLGTIMDIKWIDDAIATTPESTVGALSAYPNTQTLLLGGKNSGHIYAELEDYILNRTKIDNLILFPDSGYEMFQDLTSNIEEGSEGIINIGGRMLRIYKTKKMEEAVQFAAKYTDSKREVLLSSAAQSYSLWSGFEEKGRLFKKYILELKKETD